MIWYINGWLKPQRIISSENGLYWKVWKIKDSYGCEKCNSGTL